MVSDDQSICAGSLAPIEATIGGSATSFTWSTSGDGSFSNLSDPIATYTPGPNDLINQSVTITATTDNPNTACIPGTGMFQIFINDAPIVMLLGDQTICENETVDLNANLQAPATALTWSSTGDGSFFPINSPNATYTPGPNDLTNISTPIIITATTDDVNGTCPVGTADITVTLNAAPTLDLGSDLTSCENEDINLNSTILGGSATTIMWSTSGDGSFDNDQIINPTYNPSANDLTTGSVILSAVTDNGGGVCNTASDDITITFSTSGDASFSFPSIGCTNGNNPVPDISPSTSGSFSINNGGDIDAQTGEFLITSAILGTTYTITFTSTGNCPGDFTQDITIVGPDDPNFTYPTVSCSMGPNPIASNISGSPGNFTVDGGASIDSVTGELDLSTVIGGNSYLISFLTTGDCPSTGASSISIFDPPNAGTPTGMITTCNMGSAFIDLNTLLDDADDGGTWTDISSNPTDGFSINMFDPNNQSEDTYTFRYTIPSNAGCPEDFSEVSIFVEAQETAILDPIILSPCNDNNGSNISTINLNDLVLSTSVPGTWVDTDETGVDLSDLNNVDFAGIATGFYTFTFILPATTNCPQLPTFTTEVEVISCNCPAVQNIITASTCEGIPFIWNSIPYTVADTYVQTFPGTASTGCDSSDVIVLTVIDNPIIDLGGNSIICEGEDIFLSADLDGSANGINWSTTGDGFFDDPNIVDPVYTPGPNDLLNNSVSFMGVTQDFGMFCNPTSDNIIVNMLSPQDASFTYPENACLGGMDPQPTINPIPFGSYSVDNGAIIDPVTGILSLATTSVGQSYNITFTSNGTCPGIATETINIIPTPNAGVADLPLNICNDNGNIIDLNTLLSGADAGGVWTETSNTPSTGFSGNSFDGNGQTEGTYTFRYTVSSVNCPEDFTEVTVMIQAPITATIINMGNVCNSNNNGNNPIFNFNDLISDGSTTGTWTDTDFTGVDLSDVSNVSFDGILADTYTFTYITSANGNCPGQAFTTSITVEDCLCPSVTGEETYDGCQGDNFQVTVNNNIYNEANPTGMETLISLVTGCDSIVSINLVFNPPPNAGIVAMPQSVCNENGNILNLNSLLTGADAGGIWTETSSIPSTGFSGNQFDGIGQIAGDYTFRYTVISGNTCPDDFIEVMVTVEEPFTATLILSDNICNNSDNGNDPILNFNELITGGNTNGTWTDTDMTNVNLSDLTNVSFDGISPNTYIFTYTTPTNGSCVGQSFTTSITVEDCLCPSVTGEETYDGCQGDNFQVTVNNNIYNEANPTGMETLISLVTGCDSIVSINLVFNPPPNAGTPEPNTTACNDGGNIINLNSLLTAADAGGIWTETSATPSTGLIGNQFDPNGQNLGTYTFRYTVLSSNACTDDFTEVNITVETGNSATLEPLTLVCNSSASGSITTVDFNLIITAGDASGTWVDTEGTGVDLSDLSSVDFVNILIGTYTFTYTASNVGNCLGQSYPIEVLVRDCQCTPNTETIVYAGCTGDGFSTTVNGTIYNENNPTGTEVLLNQMNCDSIVNIDLSFSPAPTLDLGGDRFICVGELVELSANLGGIATEITWSSTGDGSFDDNQSLNPIYTPGSTDINNGFVSLTAITDNGGTTCSPALDILTLNFVAALTGSISGENTVCAGESTSISFDLNGGTLFNITYSDGSNTFTEVGIPDGFTVQVNPMITTIYTLESITSIDNTCLAIIPNNTVTVEVNELSTTASVTSEFDGFGVSCNGSSDGEITVTTIVGTPPFSFEWIDGSTTATVGNLVAGTYTITVTDGAGCTELVSATITEPAPITPFFSTVEPECFGDNNGVISIDNITGGTSPYTYAIDELPLQVVSSFPVFAPFLEAGNYNVILQDSEGCESETTVNVPAPIEFVANLGRDTTILLGDSIDLEVFFNFDPDSILWTSTSTDVCVSCTAQNVMPTSTSLYSVFASDTSGCNTTTEILITVDKPRRVFIPNAFSPNGDGTNDRFFVNSSTEVELITKFTIFDRWGEIVFNVDNTQPNDPRSGWDGIFLNNALNPGVFVYVIEVLFVDGERKLYSGDVTLIR